MKRSEVNASIEWAKALLEEHNFFLPPFGYWTLDDWRSKGPSIDAVRKTMLGWDITDFGGGDFEHFGAVLFTLRNGLLDTDAIGTPYAEKLILLKDGQRLPLHCHKSKTEDIINRGGGILAIQLYNSKSNGDVDRETPVEALMDGVVHTVEAGETVYIPKGASITLKPNQYHLFWAKAGAGPLICGEVSSVNDDRTDNYNAEPVSRFTTIEEDVPLTTPLCNEYEEVL